MADVFISYARNDQATAARVAQALTAAGFDVWWDADLPAHRAYSEIIERNLEDAKAVVVLWSKAAAKSQWVRAEADVARNAGKLVQGGLDGTTPPLPFNQIQFADLKGWRGSAAHAGWSKLLASVGALVSGEEMAAQASANRSIRDRLSTHRWSVAAAFLVLVAAAATLLFIRPPSEERKPVLAVLPFRTLDAQDASLVSGIWEDTRTAIGRNPQLIVLGPNTSQQLADNGEAASRKAADYLLEASVRTAGDRIRVSTQLVRSSDGEQVWSQDFDGKLDDVFALQSAIASEIEGRIRGRLAEKGGAVPEHIATSGDVYALYADARAKIRKRDYGQQAAAARHELEQVVKMDPNFAPGWAGLSVVIKLIDVSTPPSQNGWKIATAAGSAEQYARRAVDLAPNLAAAHSALAFSLDNKGPVALAELERAVQLDPSDYEALNWLSGALKDEGRTAESIAALRRAVEIEPFFWPAVLNLYTALQLSNDTAGIQRLVEQEDRVGATFLSAGVKMDRAEKNGNLAEAANIGLAELARNPKAPSAAIGSLWVVLVQLGFVDQAANLGAGPDFAPYLWRLDPKGLDIMESHDIDPGTFFTLEPLTENASRLYLLSGRGRKVADMYLSMGMQPREFEKVASGDGPQHFLYSAPLVAVALRQNGHGADATALLSLSETRAREVARNPDRNNLVLLARILAVEGRNEEALPLLTTAINRRWLPQAPELLPDLHSDPALASLRGDPRFEKLRDQILATINRQRGLVDARLLRQLQRPIS